MVCGQGPAPRGGDHRALPRRLGLDLVPGTGLLAAVVPGAFDAWMRCCATTARCRCATCWAPRSATPRTARPLLARIGAAIRTVEPLFREDWPTSAAVYLPGGRCRRRTLVRNPDFARDLPADPRRGRGRGPRPRGADRGGARRLLPGLRRRGDRRFCRENEVMDVTGERHTALLTGDDLAVARELRASRFARLPRLRRLQGRAVEPGAGVPAAARAARRLRPRRDGPTTGRLRPHGDRGAKLAFADREAWYGDPDFVDVPLRRCCRRPTTTSAAALIDPDGVAGPAAGAVDGRRRGRLDLPLAAGRRGRGARRRHRRAGRRRWASPGRGRHLPYRRDRPRRQHGRGDAERRLAAELAGHPRARLLPQHPGADVLARGRPPTRSRRASGRARRCRRRMATRDGEPYMAFGTPGGDQQDQWTLHLPRPRPFGMNLQEAIDAPASTPSLSRRASIRARRGRGRGRRGARRRGDDRGPAPRGHEVEVSGPWTLGRISAVAREPAGSSRPPPTRAACRATPWAADGPSRDLSCQVTRCH